MNAETPPGPRTVPLVAAAIALRLTYQGCRDLVTRGLLRGSRDADGKWRVDAADLARLAQERQAATAA